MAALIGALGDRHPKYSIMFSIGVETGLRISDILRLRAKDIKKSAAAGFTVIEKKTGKPRRVSLKPETVKQIKKYVKLMKLRPDDFLVYSRDSKKEKSLSRTQAYRVMSSVSHLFGLRNVGTHSMRKTYAVNQFCKFEDLRALQNDFNHNYESTTLAYLIPKNKIKELINECKQTVSYEQKL